MKKMKLAITILLVIFLNSGSKAALIEFNFETKLEIVNFLYTGPNNVQESDSIHVLWNKLVFEDGGCLGGQQHIGRNGKLSREFVFQQDNWRNFSSNERIKLSEFLISKLSDTTQTRIHTCPYLNASSGEMAVYSLQHLYNKNWYDFSEFKKYADRKTTSGSDNAQTWLQEILLNESSREKLMILWRSEINK